MMRSRDFWNRLLLLGLPAVLGTALAGCSLGPRNPNVQNALDMLRIERDAAEDEYYSLKQKHQEALWQIEDLESQLKKIQTEEPATGVSYDEMDDIQVLDQASLDTDGNQAAGMLTDSNWVDPRAVRVSSTGSPPRSTSSTRLPEVSDAAASDAEVPDMEASSTDFDGESEVNSIDIDMRLTRGFDSHGKTGDDGVLVAIRPLDADGRFVPVAAPVTISVIDPARNGIRQRVGLWKFSSEQVASRIDFQKQVFLFRLPWQQQSPLNADLKLFVRFQADDGKRESEMDIRVALDDAPQSGWTAVPPATESSDLSPPRVAAVPTLNKERSSQTESPPAAAGNSIQIARPEWSPIR